MSSLTSAINTAKSSLAAVQTQTALVSRNIANANTEGATRKYANVITGAGGRVQVLSIANSSNSVLFRNMLDSTSALAQSGTVQSGLERINEMIGDIENGQTPAALIGKLSDALSAYAASPSKYDFARTAADAAKDVASALNQGTQTVDTIRRDADDQLVTAASDMNTILAKIQSLNEQVVAGTAGNRDVTDLVDQRDQAVAELSQYVGVTAKTRGNNDLALYTDSGVTLFDKVPRSVSYVPTNPLVDGQDGNGFRIDGVLVTGDNAMMPIKSGKVAGLVDLRDNVATSYQSQLDEMARGLVAAFKESSSTTADAAGLFTSVDTSLLKTTSVAAAGTYTSAANGSAFSFKLTYAGKSYNVSGTVAAAGATATPAEVAQSIQTAINAQVPSGNVKVAVDPTTKAIKLSADSVASKVQLSISGVTSTLGLAEGAASTANDPIPGLARLLTVSPVVASNAAAIRDGIGVTYNTGAVGGFTDRLNALVSNLSASQDYALGTGAVASGSLATYAASSTSWLQDKRSDATTATEYKQTLLDQTKTTLSNETGINLDQESLRMLDLERSYQASSKVLTTIDEMLKTLMEAV